MTCPPGSLAGPAEADGNAALSLVLASGTDSPIADTAGENSVFARALAEELERNESLLTAPELFLRVRNRVRQSPLSDRLAEGPTLKVIKDAGHEVGDFFFIPG